MKIFVTGATGFIGSAIVPELINAGPSGDSDSLVQKRGPSLSSPLEPKMHRGESEDLESLRTGAAAADGVIHTVPSFTTSRNSKRTARSTRRAIEALGAVLAGSDRPLIVTSGTAGWLRRVRLRPKTMWCRRIPHFPAFRNRRPCR